MIGLNAVFLESVLPASVWAWAASADIMVVSDEEHEWLNTI